MEAIQPRLLGVWNGRGSICEGTYHHPSHMKRWREAWNATHACRPIQPTRASNVRAAHEIDSSLRTTIDCVCGNQAHRQVQMHATIPHDPCETNARSHPRRPWTVLGVESPTKVHVVSTYVVHTRAYRWRRNGARLWAGFLLHPTHEGDGASLMAH